MNIKDKNIFIDFDETLDILQHADKLRSTVTNIIYNHKDAFNDIFVVN